MFVFHFVNFVGNLDIQAPTYKGIPPESPILIFYKENEELSKHEISRRFLRLLNKYDISYIRPFKNLTNEWLIDLQELKNTFDCLGNTKYLKGKITLEPEYILKIEKDEYTDEVKLVETTIKFAIYPNELNNSFIQSDANLSEELNQPLKRFRKDFKSNDICGFLMMKYEDTMLLTKITNIVRLSFEKKGIKLLRADDKWYADELLLNIKTYMHGCSFGVALFERINTDYFNPNMSLEIGYMMAINKPILFLKDSTLKSLQTDLVGKLYHEYDFQAPEKTLPLVIDKWIRDNEII
jgi:hypothetical protein